MRLATATDVATVEEKTARKNPMPRRYRSASTAMADTERRRRRHREQGELDRHPQRVLELLAAEHVDVLVPTRS